MAARKNTSPQKKSSKSTSKQDNKQLEADMQKAIEFEEEVFLWIIIAISLLLLISNFGIGGFLGNMVSDFLFGMTGLVAYIFPFLLFFFTFFFSSNKGNRFAMVKMIAAILFAVFVMVFLSLLADSDKIMNPLESYAYGQSHKLSGGMIGGTVAFLLATAFGKVGAYIIDIIVLVVSMVLLTERSAIKSVKKGGRKVYETAKETQVYHNQMREQRRIDRKVVGVSSNTILDPAATIIPETPAPKEIPDMVQMRKEPVFDHADEAKELLQDIPEEVAEEMAKEVQMYAELEQDAFSLNEVEPEPAFVQPPRVSEISNVIVHPSEEFEDDKPDEKDEWIDKVFGNFEPSFEGNIQKEIIPEPVEEPWNMSQEIIPEPVEELWNMPQEVIPEPVEEPWNMPQEVIPEPRGKIWIEETFEPVEEAHEAVYEENSLEWEPDSLESLPMQEESFMEELPSPEEFEPVPPAIPSNPPVRQTRPSLSAMSSSIPTPPPASPNAIAQSIAEVQQLVHTQPIPKEYQFPPLSLLKSIDTKGAGMSQEELRETATKLQQTLKTFGVNVTVNNISCGPSVTRFEIQPELGVKVSKIVSLTDDIKLNLAATDIRIEAPIPGKAAIGIEVPNKENVIVPFRDLLESDSFKGSKSKLSFAVGKDIAGKTVVSDIAKMPHVLIAGATGSGKSVCINTIIMSILYKADPSDVKLIMIDPKVVELSVYNGIPHLLIPVVTDPKKASAALSWACKEMDERYRKFAELGVRKFDEYNAKISKLTIPEGQEPPEKMTQIVIIVDELADLMMVASGDVEASICRLAQLARAAGMHLVIATQRPSVNVITGLIKANMPSRIAFAVTSGVDSRTILDMNGAEKLLGKGDMLFHPQGLPKPVRVQGAFISDEEVSAVVEYVSEQNGGAQYNSAVQQSMDSMGDSSGKTTEISDSEPEDDGRDNYFWEAARIVVEREKASSSMLQRYLKVGYNRAGRIVDQLEEAGIVGPDMGTKPRTVLMTPEQLKLFIDENA